VIHRIVIEHGAHVASSWAGCAPDDRTVNLALHWKVKQGGRNDADR